MTRMRVFPPPPTAFRLLPALAVLCAAAGGAFDATAAASCGDYLDMPADHAPADAATPAGDSRPAPRCDGAPRPETPPAPAAGPAPPTDAVLGSDAAPASAPAPAVWFGRNAHAAAGVAGRVERPPRG